MPSVLRGMARTAALASGVLARRQANQHDQEDELACYQTNLPLY
jgi:hypothetical protein